MDVTQKLANIAKLKVSNVGRYTKDKLILESFKSNGIEFRSWKKDFRKDYGIVSFDDLEQLTKFKAALSGLCNKNGEKYVAEELESTSKASACNGGGDTARDGVSEVTKNVVDSVCPWINVPYDKQLLKKQRKMTKVLKKVLRDVVAAEGRTQSKELPAWVIERQAESVKAQEHFNNMKSEKELHQAKRAKIEGANESPSASNISVEEDGPKPDDSLQSKPFPFWVSNIPGAACPLEKIIHSPQTTQYRNKCEFTIGRDMNGNISVGFRVGGASRGSFEVESPDECVIVPKPMLHLASKLKDFIKSSKLDVYDMVEKTGFWRSAMMRYFQSTETILLMLCVRVGDLDSQIIESEWSRMKQECVSNFKYGNAQINSLSVVYYDGVSVPDPNDPYELIYGDEHVIDVLNGQKYLVSGRSFFQVNSAATELLYKQVSDLALSGKTGIKGDRKSVLLDICCGTGAIGLSMSKKFTGIIGIDSCKAAIDDAQRNAKANGIENAIFFPAMIENVIDSLMSRSPVTQESDATGDERLAQARAWLSDPNCDIVAVVDPPRAGLHRRVLRELRKQDNITRLVYVSCNPTGSFCDNAVSLCRAEHKQRPGKPFRPVTAIPVDLFPQTEHTELVVLFDRTT